MNMGTALVLSSSGLGPGENTLEELACSSLAVRACLHSVLMDWCRGMWLAYLLPVSLPCSSHFILWVHLLLFLSLKGYLFMQDSPFKFMVVTVALTLILGLREVCHFRGGLQSHGTSAQTSQMANHFPLGDWIFGYVHHSLNFGGKVGQVKCQTSSIFVTHCPLD